MPTPKIAFGSQKFTCPCGAEFEAKRPQAKWCAECKVLRSKEHGSRPRPERRVSPYRNCKQCDKPFTVRRKRSDGICSACKDPGRFSTCPDCGGVKARVAMRCARCHLASARNPFARGSKNSNWKGGRVRGGAKGAYWMLRIDGRYVMEHRYVWEQANGPIPDGWVIHHANGIKTDNRLENLIATSQEGHRHRDRIAAPYEARIRDLEGH